MKSIENIKINQMDLDSGKIICRVKTENNIIILMNIRHIIEEQKITNIEKYNANLKAASKRNKNQKSEHKNMQTE